MVIAALLSTKLIVDNSNAKTEKNITKKQEESTAKFEQMINDLMARMDQLHSSDNKSPASPNHSHDHSQLSNASISGDISSSEITNSEEPDFLKDVTTSDQAVKVAYEKRKFLETMKPSSPGYNEAFNEWVAAEDKIVELAQSEVDNGFPIFWLPKSIRNRMQKGGLIQESRANLETAKESGSPELLAKAQKEYHQSVIFSLMTTISLSRF